MRIVVLVYSEWERDYLIGLASRLVLDDDDRLCAVFVDLESTKGAESSDCSAGVKAFKDLALSNNLEIESESENHDRAQLSFVKVKDDFNLIFESICSFKPDLVVTGKQDSGKSVGNQRVVVRGLFEKLPARVLALRINDQDLREPERVLLPTAGGDNALEGIRLVSRLSRAGKKTEAFFVEEPIGSLSQEVGRKLLDDLIEKAKLGPDVGLESRVVVSPNVRESILKRSKEFDLVVVGASRESTLKKRLFGSVIDEILNSKTTSAVGVIRGELPLTSRFRVSLERVLDLVVPQLSRDDRINLYSQVQKGAVWNFDFFALISLSTIIASLGLIQNSVAVIIGAMLVAPLMTPLLGSGLSIVQGNSPLMRSSLKAVALGFVVSLLVSWLIGLIAAGDVLGSEIMARSRPTVLDMAVAMFSGVAAAYCLARPGLSSALAGIAIAAALVPPVASAGIALALGQSTVARGAALLFSTNVVSIILGAALAFFGIGIRDSEKRTGQVKFTSVILAILLMLAVALLIPLIAYLWVTV